MGQTTAVEYAYHNNKQCYVVLGTACRGLTADGEQTHGARARGVGMPSIILRPFENQPVNEIYLIICFEGTLKLSKNK